AELAGGGIGHVGGVDDQRAAMLGAIGDDQRAAGFTHDSGNERERVRHSRGTPRQFLRCFGRNCGGGRRALVNRRRGIGHLYFGAVDRRLKDDCQVAIRGRQINIARDEFEAFQCERGGVFGGGQVEESGPAFGASFGGGGG